MVTISGVNNIEPDESTNTLIRFFTGCACARRVPITTNNSDAIAAHRCNESFPMSPQ
jgi:hypothetical protein